MKYLPLIWAGLWRKRVRTVLTLLSIVVAFLLFGVMHGVTALTEQIVNQMSDTRLRIQSRVDITQPLPVAHLARIEAVDGVKGVGFYNFFGGYYREPKDSLGAGAIDLDRLDAIFPELEVAPEAIEAMHRTPNGVLIGQELATTRGWRVGDRIPIRSSIWTRKDGAAEWDVEIEGVYTFGDSKIPANEVWLNYAYFDESRAFGNGTVTLYFAHIADPASAAAISEAIDAVFANSDSETHTQNERDWLRERISRIGDMQFFVNAIIAAVMFTLLFLTGNTMMQSVRERIPELAVLKTYGFGNGAVMALVFGEAIVLCNVAAGVGIGLAALVAPSIFRTIGAGGLSLPLNVVGVGFGLALLVAVVSALPPAHRVQRLNIVDALAGR